ncbi:M57 family metalloprotease [Pyxidicoccus xibeiensis]|uniref:M57 family metalloprotease n=1 Tax=Pyxidicoccus xibeiensis TaxID=2906759 RepID=UPI0020A7524B|nr:M57 family metalloprotease [Pyxidicoccus xibeiensis]MCP3138321.1 zinc-dependent metalloprotease [Pyxidicoccus xibeiensis]
MLKRAAVLVVSCGALLAGCGADVQAENQEIISNLIEAGIPAGDITVVDEAVYMGRDTHVSLEASRELLQRGEGSQEHYRSTNLVSTAVTKICINPTASFNSYSVLSQGLNLAIVNYNSLALRITFARGPTTGCTANITAKTLAGTSVSSGLPSGGLPYNTIGIGTGLNNVGTDVVEHVITHELGHTIGLLHTDAYNPSISCGPGGGGSPGPGVGGILIPGTPTTATPGGSIMNTCMSPDTDGEFTSSDRTALNYLY